MHRTLLSAAAAFIVGGIATGAVLSQAQPPAPAPMIDAPHPGPAMPPHPGMMGWRHGHHPGHPFNPADFALVYPQPDRQLAPADVRKIAEAFLLWRGNHGWKVTDVAPTQDGGPVAFSLTTAEGSLVAKFTMDPHTGKIARVA